jgi:hypothetical protein
VTGRVCHHAAEEGIETRGILPLTKEQRRVEQHGSVIMHSIQPLQVRRQGYALQ